MSNIELSDLQNMSHLCYNVYIHVCMLDHSTVAGDDCKLVASVILIT